MDFINEFEHAILSVGTGQNKILSRRYKQSKSKTLIRWTSSDDDAPLNTESNKWICKYDMM